LFGVVDPHKMGLTAAVRGAKAWHGGFNAFQFPGSKSPSALPILPVDQLPSILPRDLSAQVIGVPIEFLILA